MRKDDEQRRRELLRQAREHSERRAYPKAIASYEQALALDPGDSRAMRRLADLYARAGRTAEARRSFLLVAEGLERKGMVLMAVGALKALLDLDPDDHEASGRLAGCYLALGMTGDAVVTLRALAETHEARSETRAAIDARRQLAACQPDDLANALRLADLLVRDGSPATALDVYRSALAQIRIDYPRSNSFLKVAQKILDLDGTDAGLMVELASIHLERGETSEVVRWLDRSHAIAPRDPGTLEGYARLFERAGLEAEAETLSGELARLLESGEVPRREPRPSAPPAAPLGMRLVEAPTPPIPALSSDLEGGRRSRRQAAARQPSGRGALEGPPPRPVPASAGRPPVPAPGAPPGGQAVAEPVAARPVDRDARPVPPSDEAVADGRPLPWPRRTSSLPPPLVVADCMDPDDEDELCDEDEAVLLDMDLLFDDLGDVEPLPRVHAPEGEADAGELDHLIAGVETLLEFDAVDRAVEVARGALERFPGSERLRALHRLTLYRSGRRPAKTPDAPGGLGTGRTPDNGRRG